MHPARRLASTNGAYRAAASELRRRCQVFAHPEYPPLMDLKLRQVGFADMVILNKVDLAGREQVGKVKAWLDDHFNRLRIVETDHCDEPPDAVEKEAFVSSYNSELSTLPLN